MEILERDRQTLALIFFGHGCQSLHVQSLTVNKDSVFTLPKEQNCVALGIEDRANEVGESLEELVPLLGDSAKLVS